jgi:release factor glutamine methyltransferase
MTIQEAGKYSIDQLRNIYEEGEAASISDWLMESLSGIRKTDRISNRKQLLSPEQTSQLDIYLQRLLAQEPIQYVLNESWFCGLKFYVDENVLIPRPETEELVEWIITNCRFPIGTLSILDIGTGSGAIPIALKRRLGKAGVWGIDISEKALEVARRNATTLGADIKLQQLDFLDTEQHDKLSSFDIIISNPPYVPEKDKEQMQPNVLKYEPGMALFVPDNDPLVFYKAIAEFGKDHLNNEGMIFMEIHEDLGEAVSSLFKLNGYTTEIKKDMQGKERMMKSMLL